jgi:Leucine-rich repeat (LRR) protein
MPIREIKLNNADAITYIDCGTTSPRFGGEIFLADFPNLISLNAPNHDLTAVYYNTNSNLQVLNIFGNNLGGQLPDLSQMTSLKEFRIYDNNFNGSLANILSLPSLEIINCGFNQFNGNVPNISNRPNLRIFRCNNNSFTNGIPALVNLPSIQYLDYYRNYNLGGPIPQINHLTTLIEFLCYQNGHTGEIPDLTGLVNLEKFSCYNNDLVGAIPNISTLAKLKLLHCGGMSLTSFAGGSIPATLKDIQIHNNFLTSAEVDKFLAALAANGSSGGTAYIGGGNQGNPTAAGDASIATLVSRGWTIGEAPPIVP